MSSRDPIRSMWAESLALLEQADKLHRQFFQPGISRARGPTWEPPVDVYETQRELMFIVALPGVPADAVKVVIDGGSLTVVGRRSIPAPPSAALLRLEIPYGNFERRIDLPPGIFEIVRRELADGCLLITLRKHS